MNDLKTYNLLVIGGGPAGVIAAMTASTFGHSVPLVDKQQDIGGAGINTGTVPSKPCARRLWPCLGSGRATFTESIFRYAAK